jgi:hypothetical protein
VVEPETTGGDVLAGGTPGSIPPRRPVAISIRHIVIGYLPPL